MKRLLTSGVLAALAVILAGGPAEAFGGRMAKSSGCAPVQHDTCCYYYYPGCYPPICWPPIYCPPVYYTVSEPAVSINGPFPTLVRPAKMGHGVIVQIDVPGPTFPSPTGFIQLAPISGAGSFQYVGYNTTVVNPLPGGGVRYSVYLLPTAPGPVSFKVGLAYSDNTFMNVPYTFDIKPY